MVPCQRTPTDLRGLSALIVDDNRDAADTLADLLAIYGCDARVAYDAESALVADPSDVVILEMRLPGMGGQELVRRMRQRWAAKQPLYLAVTTCCGREALNQSAEVGIALHLVKPVDPVALLDALKRVVRMLTLCAPLFPKADNESGTHDCLGVTCS